jgi:hypothetical protein
MAPTLPLEQMADRHQALTPALAESYLEAARVCLDRHHASPQAFTIQTKTSASQATARWNAADDRVPRFEDVIESIRALEVNISGPR